MDKPEGKRGAPRHIGSDTEFEKVKTKAENALAAWASSGEGEIYKIKKVINASSQIVAGTLHKLLAEIETSDGTTKICKLHIWSRPWLPNGTELTIIHEDESEVKFKY